MIPRDFLFYVCGNVMEYVWCVGGITLNDNITPSEKLIYNWNCRPELIHNVNFKQNYGNRLR